MLTDVAPQFPQLRFTIVGGPVTDRFRAAAPPNVDFTGFVTDVATYMRNHDLVIGSGRVALEAMRIGRPVVAVGEACYLGSIDDHSIVRAKATNFGDCEIVQPIDFGKIVADIERYVVQGELMDTRRYSEYLREYDERLVFSETMKVYRDASLEQYLGRYAEVPVLMYHRVVEHPPPGSVFNVFVTAAEMDAQLASLRKRGYEPVTFRDLKGGVQVAKPVILTFDDGYQDNFHVLLPLLKKYSAKAVIYALGDRSLRENVWDIEKGEPAAALMTDAQLRACHVSGLVEIGSHGMTHRRLPDLSDDAARTEIAAAKPILEAVINSPVLSFAYPYGAYSDRDVGYVKDAGYAFGIGTVNGPLSMRQDFFRIRRITVFPHTHPLEFWKKTSGWYLRYCKLKGKDF